MSKHTPYGPVYGREISVGIQAAGSLLSGQAPDRSSKGEIVMPRVTFVEVAPTASADTATRTGIEHETPEETQATINEARAAVHAALQQGELR